LFQQLLSVLSCAYSAALGGRTIFRSIEAKSRIKKIY